MDETKILERLFSKYKAEELMNIIKEQKFEQKIKNFSEEEILILKKLFEGYKKAKKEIKKEIFTFKETFRFSTRSEVSKARIDTLKKIKVNFNTILDSTAGIGLATLFFSKYFKKVYSVEIDYLRYLFLKKNLEYYNIKNVEAYNLNVKSQEAKKIIEKADLIFVDPERIESNKKRFLEENKPELNFFLNLKKNFLYELSPRIDLKEIYFNLKNYFETKNSFIELFSKNQRHSRTTFYHFKNKNFNFNIIVKNEFLEEEKGTFNNNFNYDYDNFDFEKKFLLDIDNTLLKSTLIEQFVKKLERKFKENLLLYFDNKRLLSSVNNVKVFLDEDTKLETYENIPFTNVRKIIKIVDVKSNVLELKKEIKKINDFKKLILKFSIDEKEYYNFVNKIRKSEEGNINVYLYKIKDKYIIAV